MRNELNNESSVIAVVPDSLIEDRNDKDGNRKNIRFDDFANEYIKYGLSPIPVNGEKQPTTKWKPFQEQIMPVSETGKYFNQYQVEGIAIVCGPVSGNLEVIDVDSKYDRSGTLWTDFYNFIQIHLPE
jgi:hypothetical protein